MGVSVSEHSIFYSADVSNLEELRKFLINQCKECEDKRFGQEINLKTEAGNELFGWDVMCKDIIVSKRDENTFEFHFYADLRSHSNFKALKELSEKYKVGFCYWGGGAEAGGYQIYDPEKLYYEQNFEQMRFSNPDVNILFERKKAPDGLSNEDQEIYKKPIEDFCKTVHSFFELQKIKHSIYKINDNAFYVKLNCLKLGCPFISSTLEEIKTGLNALNSSLFLWTAHGKKSLYKASLYFYIDSGSSDFKDLQPGTLEWAQAEESFEYEGDFVDITNDKNSLFFKKHEFSNILDFNIVSGEDGSVVEEIKQIDMKSDQPLNFA